MSNYKGTYKKSTLEKVETMLRLYELKISINEIAKRLEIDRTTVRYWLKKRMVFIPGRGCLSAKEAAKISVFGLEEQDKEEIEEQGEQVKEAKKDLCLTCGKEKTDLVWILTKYCSRDCWDQVNSRVLSKFR